MGNIMVFIRSVLGSLILLFDFITRPKPLMRGIDTQDKIDKITSNISLYQFHACPFCIKVRRYMRKNSFNIELKDAKNNAKYKNELVHHGGKHKVPCLRIYHNSKKIEWIYESNEIIVYLQSIHHQNEISLKL
jgi:glutaredoxin